MKALMALCALAVTFSAFAVEQMPGRMRSACERMLVDAGWVKTDVRARIMPLDEQVNMLNEDGFPTPIVAVTGPGRRSPVRFARTKRSVSDMVDVDRDLPVSFFRRVNLQGKKVLDLACGEGRAVEDLRRAGVDAEGLDIHLSAYQLSKPYFIRASAFNTHLPAESYDVIYSVQGPFTYLENDHEKIRALMIEARRLLKPGGVLRLSAVTTGDFKVHGARPEIDLKDTVYTDLPSGMRILSAPDKWWFFDGDTGEGHDARYWLEIQKQE